jgi:hypothetical protein
VGFPLARLSVYGLASLVASPHLLFSVTAFQVSVARIMPQKLPFVKPAVPPFQLFDEKREYP